MLYYSDPELWDRLSHEQRASLERIAVNMPSLGPNALRILEDVANRLAMGAKVYARDFDGGNDWIKEAREEALDLLVYLTRAAN